MAVQHEAAGLLNHDERNVRRLQPLLGRDQDAERIVPDQCDDARLVGLGKGRWAIHGGGIPTELDERLSAVGKNRYPWFARHGASLSAGRPKNGSRCAGKGIGRWAPATRISRGSAESGSHFSSSPPSS